MVREILNVETMWFTGNTNIDSRENSSTDQKSRSDRTSVHYLEAPITLFGSV